MTTSPSGGAAPARWLIVAAFAAIYLLWGSTYIAIRFSVEIIPPFLMSGTRFLVAGLLLFGWARLNGAPWPTWRNWRTAITAAVMLFVLNNGTLVWAAQYVPSGLLALLVGATPLWMVLLDWWRPTVHGRQAGGVRPSNVVFGGLLLGFFGIFLLTGADEMTSSGPEFAIGVVAVLIGTVGWAAGSIYTRQSASSLPESPILCSGMQLVSGGLMLVTLSAVTGQSAGFQLADVTLRAGLSWAWLVIGGSILGFGSYIWLMRVSTPARVATYAYVNPVVAIVLGWALAGETLSLRTAVAAAIILGAVMIINSARTRKPKPRPVALASESGA
jgi:drug/metabolite transporter (DMT)-like permease